MISGLSVHLYSRAPAGFSVRGEGITIHFPIFPRKFRLKFAIFLYFRGRFGGGGISPPYKVICERWCYYIHPFSSREWKHQILIKRPVLLYKPGNTCKAFNAQLGAFICSFRTAIIIFLTIVFFQILEYNYNLYLNRRSAPKS